MRASLQLLLVALAIGTWGSPILENSGSHGIKRNEVPRRNGVAPNKNSADVDYVIPIDKRDEKDVDYVIPIDKRDEKDVDYVIPIDKRDEKDVDYVIPIDK
ncbi:hypothetical protein LY76DRAFT_655905 [Colletotrichum caudatum]|nr:hypothetical protein LY76DRAFT_655905 [Colletotrichum caudatum]